MSYISKMKDYRIKQQFKLLKGLLETINEITDVFMANQANFEEKETLIQSTYSISSLPDSKLPITATHNEVCLWLKNLLQKANIQDETEYFLHLDQYEESFWVTVSVKKTPDWLYHLWEQLRDKSFSITSHKNSVIVISDEEHYFCSFIIPISD